MREFPISYGAPSRAEKPVKVYRRDVDGVKIRLRLFREKRTMEDWRVLVPFHATITNTSGESYDFTSEINVFCDWKHEKPHSLKVIYDILSSLCIMPGDTDKGHFDSYSERQMQWVNQWDCTLLGAWVIEQQERRAWL